MEGPLKQQKTVVDPFWSRILAAPLDEAVARCIDVFSRLVNSGSALDRNLFLGLVYIAKVRSEIFCKQELSLKVLSPTLKPMSMEGKDVLLPLLACNLLVKVRRARENQEKKVFFYVFFFFFFFFKGLSKNCGVAFGLCSSVLAGLLWL